jgi:thiamine-phosphate pyrophosphorylase
MRRCLVTDRRRLCPGAASFGDERRHLVEQARRAIAQRVDLIQIREPDLPTTDLVTLVEDFLSLARGSATRILVNDRIDVALACGADGVHLRADSPAPNAVRTIVPPGFAIGRSIHTVDDVKRSAGADYLIAGTVFPSLSKPQAERLLGIAGLKAIVAASPIPVLAIGGITTDNISAIASTGAAGIAAIGLFVDSL